jgi:hypothetical protein
MTSRRQALDTEWKRLRSEYPELNLWTFRVDRGLSSSLGNCNGKKRLIKVAAWWTDGDYPIDSVIDTLRHEVAHALAGVRHGHNLVWMSWAARLGAIPQRCSSAVKKSDSPSAKRARWAVRCEGCQATAIRHRLPIFHEYASHKGCGGRLKFERRATS